jgi:hypothetical protein
VRKALLILGLLVALAIPAGGDGGTGFTGCTQQTASHSGGLPFFSSVNHYLIVNYCKRQGTITSISIAAHGCDVRGFAFCFTGPAFMTGGGVGSGYATFQAHATWGVTLAPLYNNNDVITLTVPVG